MSEPSLSPRPWADVKELLADALELPLDERSAWLERVAADDPPLHAELADLLALAGGRALPAAPLVDLRERDQAPSSVGPYRLRAELGRGGMGTVYLGERADGELEQKVAIKVLRRGLDTQDIIRRFRAERQILADLSHPYIARLLDGGSTADGRPYFVLEWVDGGPIDRWVAEHGLAVRERLELFLKVCEAVSYAHRNLVVHRDLKPGNVLVTAGGTPRLVDFGIAKLLREGPEAALTVTAAAQPMTLRYASPEQLRGVAVGTGTDVYGLGLLLYELLAGEPAYRLEDLTPHEISRVVCEVEPARPSQVAARDPARRPLRRQLEGDLDTIVLRALAKDPERRFPSVEQLAEDVRRHLDGRPLLSRPGSAVGRLLKAARRHAIPTALGAGLSLVILTFATTMAVQRAELARESARALAEAAAARQAEREAEDVSSFLLGLFEAGEVGRARIETKTARELLALGLARAERQLAARPAELGRLRLTIARAYFNLGLYGDAEAQASGALAARAAAQPANPLEVAEALQVLGEVLTYAGRPAEAQPRLERALAFELEGLPATDPQLATTRLHLGTARAIAGDAAGARAQLEAALIAFEAARGPDAPEVADVLVQLGAAELRSAELDLAERHTRRALAIRRQVLGPKHRGVAIAQNALALVTSRRGRLAETRELLESSLAIFEATLGPEHPEVAAVLQNLANLAAEQGRGDPEVESLFRRALAINERAFGPSSLAVAANLEALGNLRSRQRRLSAALPLLERALAIRRKLLGEEHATIALSLNNLADAYARNGRCWAAEPLFVAARDLARRVEGETAYMVAGPLHGLGQCRLAAGKRSEAAALFRQSLAILNTLGFSAEHPVVRKVAADLARAGG